MVYDGGEAALGGAGADDADDGPSEVWGPDHERPATVPGAGRLLARGTFEGADHLVRDVNIDHR